MTLNNEPSEADVLKEWLRAIRLEIKARTSPDLATILYFANAALGGEIPHWYTDEYQAKVAAAASSREVS